MASIKEDGEGGRTIMEQLKGFMATPLGAVFVFLSFVGGGLYVIKKLG
jgi:hypothetical protein